MDTQVSQSSGLLFSVGTADSQGRPTRRPRPGPGFGKQRLAAPKPSTTVKKEGTNRPQHKLCVWAYGDIKGPDQSASVQSNQGLHCLLTESLVTTEMRMYE